ncbi:hypothetical protein Sme01_62940 [Sphaerisporangium melleum]|uniref:Uncharacterized protein n=1 Tax=Sphaerisporangium melleum TaxID=321316 RepID=A0A917VI90_9ACTN|nr:hypothetical protein GCM10007964_25410 [Sphaerisporangium melleum]GII73818.1 hypothetical protein Sme01_62940 [Sphaerisporangium melleum]
MTWVLGDKLGDNGRGQGWTVGDCWGMYGQVRAGDGAGPTTVRFDLQARGHWFEPSSAHQPKRPVSDLGNGAWATNRVTKDFGPREDADPGSRVPDLAVSANTVRCRA